MQVLTPEGRQMIEGVAQRHGVSTDAAVTLLMALAAGQGTQAQFSHPELGGMGQWSQGGMIMVGDMFNQGLKARVDALCTELAGLLRSGTVLTAASQSQSQSGAAGVSLFVPGAAAPGGWWPAELGSPGSTGAQNSMRYALFPAQRRLAIDLGGQVSVYDTGDHLISGFSQQQGGDQSLTFTSQHGLVRVADLAAIPAGSGPTAAVRVSSEPPAAATPAAAEPTSVASDDVFGKIERLAGLRDKKLITDQEFEAKKAELLSRL